MTVQDKNDCWFLPRPKPDHYKGGMPLHCEGWLLREAEMLLGKEDLNILNLFCGMNTHGFRVDVNEEVNPDLLCDVHTLSEKLPSSQRESFDFVLADPPYSTEENMQLYGLKAPLRYKQWTSEADKFLKVGGIFCVYHKYMKPNPAPERYECVRRICVLNRTNHLPRVAMFWKKLKA